MIDPDQHIPNAWEEGAGGHDLFSDGSLQERAARAGSAYIQYMRAPAKSSCWEMEFALFTWASRK